MSQEKVDLYKKEKANRKANVKKEKRLRFARKIGYSLFGLVLIGWIGYSAYHVQQEKKPATSTEVNYEAFVDYLQAAQSSTK